MNRIAALAAALLLAGCVKADMRHTAADGGVTEAHLSRLWANTSLTIDPSTGAIHYTSQPQSEAVGKALDIAGEALVRVPKPFAAEEPAPLFVPQTMRHPPGTPLRRHLISLKRGA